MINQSIESTAAQHDATLMQSCNTSKAERQCTRQRVHEEDIRFYRDRTIGLLKRYLRFSIEAGRLPSLLGGQLFRARVTAYKATTFEDAIIFVHDVEKVLKSLEEFDRLLITRIVFQEYTQEEAARLVQCSARTVVRRFPAAIDRATALFLESGILVPFDWHS